MCMSVCVCECAYEYACECGGRGGTSGWVPVGGGASMGGCECVRETVCFVCV